MQFYVDTADLESIKHFAKLGVISGVTTNPTLIHKSGANLEQRIKEICEVVSGPVSSEVYVNDREGMIKQALEFVTWAPNVYVKLPCTELGLEICSELSSKGISVNMTLVFSVSQALLAARAGATLVSPFVGRLDDIGEDGVGLIRYIRTAFDNDLDIETKILAASIRNIDKLRDVALAGADIATVPPEVLELAMKHELTDKGLAVFLKDAQAIKE